MNRVTATGINLRFSIINNTILKQKILTILKFSAFFTLGVFIFWLVYRDQDVNRIKDILRNDVNYSWIWFSLFLSFLSHLSRTIRWMILIEPLGKKPGRMNTFLAVMVGYLMNLVLPRMGEISRCGVLARYEKISFSKLVGTVVTERLVDVVMLLLLTFLVIITQFGQIIGFLNNNPDVKEKLWGLIASPWVLLAVAAMLIGLWTLRRRIMKLGILNKLSGFVQQFGEGLRTIRTMKNKWAFIGHTVFIWFMYYMMLFISFYAFEFTEDLTALAGLTAFVLSSYGMVAPVQGGIGAWHFMVIEALVLYGVTRPDSTVFALVAHSAMTGMLIVIGLISLVALPFVNRKNI